MKKLKIVIMLLLIIALLFYLFTSKSDLDIAYSIDLSDLNADDPSTIDGFNLSLDNRYLIVDVGLRTTSYETIVRYGEYKIQEVHSSTTDYVVYDLVASKIIDSFSAPTSSISNYNTKQRLEGDKTYRSSESYQIVPLNNNLFAFISSSEIKYYKINKGFVQLQKDYEEALNLQNKISQNILYQKDASALYETTTDTISLGQNKLVLSNEDKENKDDYFLQNTPKNELTIYDNTNGVLLNIKSISNQDIILTKDSLLFLVNEGYLGEVGNISILRYKNNMFNDFYSLKNNFKILEIESPHYLNKYIYRNHFVCQYTDSNYIKHCLIVNFKKYPFSKYYYEEKIEFDDAPTIEVSPKENYIIMKYKNKLKLFNLDNNEVTIEDKTPIVIQTYFFNRSNKICIIYKTDNTSDDNDLYRIKIYDCDKRKLLVDKQFPYDYLVLSDDDKYLVASLNGKKEEINIITMTSLLHKDN